MLDQHAFKVGLNFSATELELLDNVGYLLEAVYITVGNTGSVGDHQKSCTFKQYNFICPADGAIFVKMRLQESCIWD